MKWDIDKCLAELEKLTGSRVPGTSFTRAIVTPGILQKEGLKLTKEEAQRDSFNVWCLALGGHWAPKNFFYGRSLREAYLQARKALKPHGKPRRAVRR